MLHHVTNISVGFVDIPSVLLLNTFNTWMLLWMTGAWFGTFLFFYWDFHHPNIFEIVAPPATVPQDDKVCSSPSHPVEAD